MRALLGRGEFFWLDLLRPNRAQLGELAEAAGVDPEALQRALHFGQVPHLRLFRGHARLVFHGAEPTPAGPPEPVEVHVYVSDGWVVSVREEPCRALDNLHSELGDNPPTAKESIVARVLGALAGSFAGPMQSLDEDIERFEEQAAAGSRPAPDLRHEMLERRDRLIRARRLVRRQRDYVERAVDEIRHPRLRAGPRHELQDVAGEMIRVADRVDDALDRLATALDMLNASVANRLNAIMERLTVVATIFLPLTVVTGFFGQNFGWMTSRINSLADFLVLGVGLFFGSALLISMWIRARLMKADGR